MCRICSFIFTLIFALSFSCKQEGQQNASSAKSEEGGNDSNAQASPSSSATKFNWVNPPDMAVSAQDSQSKEAFLKLNANERTELGRKLELNMIAQNEKKNDNSQYALESYESCKEGCRQEHNFISPGRYGCYLACAFFRKIDGF